MLTVLLFPFLLLLLVTVVLVTLPERLMFAKAAKPIGLAEELLLAEDWNEKLSTFRSLLDEMSRGSETLSLFIGVLMTGMDAPFQGTDDMVETGL